MRAPARNSSPAGGPYFRNIRGIFRGFHCRLVGFSVRSQISLYGTSVRNTRLSHRGKPGCSIRRRENPGARRDADSVPDHSRFGLRIGDFFLGHSEEFFPDDVGWKSGGEQRAVQRSDFLFADLAAKEAKLAFDPVTDHRCRIFFFGRVFQGVFDVFVGNSPGAEIPGDAEWPLLAGFAAHPGELSGVARIFEQVAPSTAPSTDFTSFSSLQRRPSAFFISWDRMRAAHQHFDCSFM